MSSTLSCHAQQITQPLNTKYTGLSAVKILYIVGALDDFAGGALNGTEKTRPIAPTRFPKIITGLPMGLSHADRRLCDALSKPELVTMMNTGLANLQAENATLQAEVARLREQNANILKRYVSITTAEEARIGAFRLARARAAEMAEGTDGCPTPLSHAIEQMKEPMPRWRQ